jgi:hypothetical protein
MSTLEENLQHLENHLTEALNAALQGSCKAKGIIRLECALATLAEIKEQIQNGSDK